MTVVKDRARRASEVFMVYITETKVSLLRKFFLSCLALVCQDTTPPNPLLKWLTVLL